MVYTDTKSKNKKDLGWKLFFYIFYIYFIKNIDQYLNINNLKNALIEYKEAEKK